MPGRTMTGHFLALLFEIHRKNQEQIAAHAHERMCKRVPEKLSNHYNRDACRFIAERA
jgi:hypothetical protein